jgi:hypothetical protein
MLPLMISIPGTFKNTQQLGMLMLRHAASQILLHVFVHLFQVQIPIMEIQEAPRQPAPVSIISYQGPGQFNGLMYFVCVWLCHQ